MARRVRRAQRARGASARGASWGVCSCSSGDQVSGGRGFGPALPSGTSRPRAALLRPRRLNLRAQGSARILTAPWSLSHAPKSRRWPSGCLPWGQVVPGTREGPAVLCCPWGGRGALRRGPGFLGGAAPLSAVLPALRSPAPSRQGLTERRASSSRSRQPSRVTGAAGPERVRITPMPVPEVSPAPPPTGRRQRLCLWFPRAERGGGPRTCPCLRSEEREPGPSACLCGWGDAREFSLRAAATRPSVRELPGASVLRKVVVWDGAGWFLLLSTETQAGRHPRLWALASPAPLPPPRVHAAQALPWEPLPEPRLRYQPQPETPGGEEQSRPNLLAGSRWGQWPGDTQGGGTAPGRPAGQRGPGGQKGPWACTRAVCPGGASGAGSGRWVSGDAGQQVCPPRSGQAAGGGGLCRGPGCPGPSGSGGGVAPTGARRGPPASVD